MFALLWNGHEHTARLNGQKCQSCGSSTSVIAYGGKINSGKHLAGLGDTNHRCRQSAVTLGRTGERGKTTLTRQPRPLSLLLISMLPPWASAI